MQEEKGLVDEEARERDALYERAERLTSALLTIGDSLRDIIEDVNAGMRLRHLSAASCSLHALQTLKVSIEECHNTMLPMQPKMGPCMLLASVCTAALAVQGMLCTLRNSDNASMCAL